MEKLLTETEKTTIKNAKEFITKIFANESSSHDTQHSLRVYENALKIYESEVKFDKNINLFVVLISALLHDVDDYKLEKSDVKSEENRNLKAFMSNNKMDKMIQSEIVDIVNSVSFKGSDTKTPEKIEGKIVQDADRLDAIGAIGIARAFDYGGSKHRKIYNNNTVKELKDRNFIPFDIKMQSFDQYKNKKNNKNNDTLYHFYEKLLLIKGLMNTEYGKIIAEKRTNCMKMFLEELYNELNV